jgi:beta-glucosidase
MLFARSSRLLLGGLLLLLAGFLAAPTILAEDTKPNPAVKAVAREGNKGWMARHEKFVERGKKGDVDVVFLGDSITHGWENNGKKVWAKVFEPMKAVNFGISSD